MEGNVQLTSRLATSFGHLASSNQRHLSALISAALNAISASIMILASSSNLEPSKLWAHESRSRSTMTITHGEVRSAGRICVIEVETREAAVKCERIYLTGSNNDDFDLHAGSIISRALIQNSRPSEAFLEIIG